MVVRRSLVPLFFIASTAVGVEIALTRFFAVASWSEYGYWVISIALSGFAVAGIVMVLAQRRFAAWAGWLLPALPLAMLVLGALGWIALAAIPFNPLELQNPTTAPAQLGNIALYYAALFPFFFLAGLAVSLNFVVHSREVGRVYGYDLLGAGSGALAALLLLYVVHPFHLLPALLALLAVAAWVDGRRSVRVATLVVLGGAEAAMFLFAAPRINEFKPIFAPLHVADSRVVGEVLSPRGVYQLLDNFTERVDTDVSFNAGIMGGAPPPRSFGLYRDGIRIAALPKSPPVAAYASSTLDAAPYALLNHPNVLLLGAGGSFRVAEALELGAGQVTVIEPEPVLRDALLHGFGPSPALANEPRVTISDAHPLRAEGRFDLIDVAGDFLTADSANAYVYTTEAIARYIGQLAPGGLLSMPISIRELPAYAMRLLATARDGLTAAGIADPAGHIAVIRSAWNLRVLMGAEPLAADRIAALGVFADDRSFDLSYAPGLSQQTREIWNDLPPIKLESRTVPSGGPFDAVAEETPLILAGTPPVDAFDRSAMTLDRPWLSPLIRVAAASLALERVEVLPQQEIGLLVNVAVLAQAALLALVVALLPAAARGAFNVRFGILGRALLYFPALGLGFLMIEIALIEHGALLLGDRTSSFALILTTMLVGSGFGALWAGKVKAPRRTLIAASAIAVLSCTLALLLMDTAIRSLLSLPVVLRALLLLSAVVPLSMALGFPFALGLDRFQQWSPAMLPWAWALNGAFSVVATPLANLLGHTHGLSALLLVGIACYVLAAFSFPGRSRT